MAQLFTLPPRPAPRPNAALWHQLERIARTERKPVTLPRLTILEAPVGELAK